MTITNRLLCAVLVPGLVACATPAPTPPAQAHLRAENLPAATANIPPPVQQTLALPAPKPAAKTETYSVVVNNVKVQELLFALARDAKLNVDIHPGISGTVTLNAIDQTLPQLLNRLAKQVDMRWELDGPNLAVMPDSPYLRHYRIDYVNMSRDTSGTVAVTTQITTTLPGGAGGAGSANNSITRIENSARNRFWETLIQNVKDLLRETDKILPEGSSETLTEQISEQQTSGTGAAPAAGYSRGAQAAPSNLAASPNPANLQTTGATLTRRVTFREAAAVIANPETGILTIRATARQHEKIQEFVDQVMASAKRQVLIEATIVEVQLSANYQQGIDWSRIESSGTGFTLKQLPSPTATISSPAASLFQLAYANASPRGDFLANLNLLEAFGTVKVLSSPKISVLNNQTAVLKVIDNRVYFTIKADTSQNQTNTVTTFTTTLNSVPVGLVLNVTPQVSEDGTILLNLRPSISRIIGTVADPNPALKKSTSNGFDSDIISSIPVIRTREMESMLRVEDGNIAVMGGLMEDSIDNQDNGIPGLARVPVAGALFSNRNDTNVKTELVIFLRPVVVREASLGGDYRGLRGLLPNAEFFANNPGPQYQVAPATSTGARP